MGVIPPPLSWGAQRARTAPGRSFPSLLQGAHGSSMDLRKSFPRSMRVKMEGYVHLARMIDKCRAVPSGTEGEYIYPCPMMTGSWSSQRSRPINSPQPSKPIHQTKQWQNGSHRRRRRILQPSWKHENRMMLKRGPSTPEKQKNFNQLRDTFDPSRTDLTSWADLQDLEEGRPVPTREPVRQLNAHHCVP